MKSELVAMPVYEERISPLLDVSERFVIFEVKGEAVTQKIEISIDAENERFRIRKLKELGVSVIISGAVSRYLSHIITGTGLKLIPWISGPADDVIKSFLDNTLISVLPEKGSCGGMMRRRKLVSGNGCGAQTSNNDKKGIL